MSRNFSCISISLLVVALAACGPKSSPENTVEDAIPAPFPDTIEAQLPKVQDVVVDDLPLNDQPGVPDLTNGKRQYAKCKICHTLMQGERNKIGPNLYGVLGRPAASLPGFRYSAALKASGIIWDENTLSQWVQNPRQTVPKTSMTFVGVRDDKSRRDLLAYLLKQTSPVE